LYPSANAVVLAGLRLLQEQKQDRQMCLEELRKEIAVGLEQAERGELAPLDIDEIKAEGRRRLANSSCP
jgi:antitoxin ParD1/3/4